MAPDMPTVVIPQTPPPEEALADGDYDDQKPAFNPNALSPLSQNFSTIRRMGSLGTMSPPPTGSLSPAGSMPPYSPMTGTSASDSFPDSENVRNPFNFQTVQYAPGRAPVGKSVRHDCGLLGEDHNA